MLASIGLSNTSPHELYKEYPDAKEAAEFKSYAEQIHQVQLNLAKGAPVARPLHAKAHGCLKGTFKINENLTEDLQHGVFQLGAEYPIWARFSNASGTPKSDHEPDMRGFAIKLMKVNKDGSGIQDFLMTNGPVHFVSNAKEMMAFAEAKSLGGESFAKFMASHPKAAVILLKDTEHKVASMVTERYWSRTPFRIGKKAMKFRTIPCDGLTASAPKERNETYLTDDLRNRAEQEKICFDFQVQSQMDAERQPIEDASVEWLEKDSPFVSVARIIFQPQKFDSTEQSKFCDDLDFSPWNATPNSEHPDLQPLGNMNRARKIVYPSSAGFRGASWKQPNGSEDFNRDPYQTDRK